jgi:hypothetical protein
MKTVQNFAMHMLTFHQLGSDSLTRKTVCPYQEQQHRTMFHDFFFMFCRLGCTKMIFFLEIMVQNNEDMIRSLLIMCALERL